MSDAHDDKPILDTCGCCDGVSADTPEHVHNPPGLPAIRYRVGTHATFKSSMLARLATAELPPHPLLPVPPAPAPDLRSGDDFSAGLIDAFAVVADVLTFYQERIINESFLRTATERRSILELARTIGYELKPGRAAFAPLTLTIEEPPKLAPNVKLPPEVTGTQLRAVPIAAGTKVQSVPGPGEKPQTFETIDDVVAYPEWNEIKPRRFHPNYVPTNKVWTRGRVDVKRGETIAVHANSSVAATVAAVHYDDEDDLTRIDFLLDEPVVALGPPAFAPLTLEKLISQKFKLDDQWVQISLGMAHWQTADLRMVAAYQEWSLDDLTETLRRMGVALAASNAAFSTFAVRAAPFGHNAPAYDYIPNPDPNKVEEQPYVIVPSEFNGRSLWANGDETPRIPLDGAYPLITAPSIALLWRTSKSENVRVVYEVQRVYDQPRTSRTINARVTFLDVQTGGADPEERLDEFFVRGTAVLAGSTRFAAPTRLDETTIKNATFDLDGVYLNLRVGGRIAISGERADAAGLRVTEVATLKLVTIVDAGYTRLVLEDELAFEYVRRTVTINANIAPATHGETVEEVLGSGNAGIAYQSFTLKQSPLTYIGAKTASGIASTLRVTVNDVIWKEVPRLYGRGPRERIYVTRRNDDGTYTIQFGDGITGARLPTGQDNVRAKYRKGIGLEGLLGRDRISLLLSRPLGLKSAVNQVPTSDAADPEPRDEARRNAPLTVLTLDRVVSLRDFEDFARARTGINKALASWMQGKHRRGVFVTVAGPNGLPITDTKSIEAALHDLGDRLVPLKVCTYRQLFFRITADVLVDEDRIPDVVKAEIEKKLRGEFSFEQRSFGQPVHRSEVIAAIQSVAGVKSVNLKTLEALNQPTPPLLAAVPEGDLASANDGAELLILDPRPISLVVTQ